MPLARRSIYGTSIPSRWKDGIFARHRTVSAARLAQDRAAVEQSNMPRRPTRSLAIASTRRRKVAPSSVETTVLVFLKAPRPGYVKTRLAATIGGAAANRLYRELAERQL